MKSFDFARQPLNGRAPLMLFTLAVLIVALCAIPLYITHAANPNAGTLSTSNTRITYTGGPFVQPNVSSEVPANNNKPVCDASNPCDDFALTVTVPSGYEAANNVRVTIAWQNTAADFDVYILDSTGREVTRAASSKDPETVIFPAAAGTYTVRVVPFNPLGESYAGTIELIAKPTVVAASPVFNQGAGIAPRFQNYVAPPALGNSAGEPSIGVDWLVKLPSLRPTASNPTLNTGGVSFFTAGNQELRASFDDCSSPAKDIWKDVSSPFVQQAPLSDPIGTVDYRTGRVFQGNLIGGEGNSFLAYSDDDGNTSAPAQGGGLASGVDHQSIGAGPYNENALVRPVHPTYPNAIYYCSQSVGEASCSRSDDGGQTFGPTVPIYTAADCSGLHGHVKVAPDGTVYVPNKGCGGTAVGRTTQAVVVSEDNGVSWTVRPVTGSTPAGNDPSVGIGADGTIYFGYQDVKRDQSNNVLATYPRIAVSRDKGRTWSDTQDVGVPFGIQNIAFPVVVAGDANRAAFGFVGTPTGGNSQDGATFKGIWHLYIATTYDGGKSYITVDATPNDPVQVGSICISGTTCGADRNLLDFNDLAIDKEGRPVLAYADGCVAPQCNVASAPNASRSAKATIARQSGGRRLFARFDPVEPATPAAPRLESAARIAGGIDVVWSEPDNGGSPLTGYNILRGTVSGGETLIATIGASRSRFLDTTATDTSIAYFYRITAINAAGTGGFCGELSVAAGPAPVATPPPDPCTVPGTKLVDDPTADQVGAPSTNKDLDIQSVSIAEPAFSDGSNKLVFTMKVADLSTVPPDRQWRIIWTPATAPSSTEDRYYVGMTSNAGGAVTYEYGTVTANGNVPTTRGAADIGSYTADGTIRITISNSKVGNPQRGNSLGALSGRNFAGTGTGTLTKSSAADSTADVSYTLAGNSSCTLGTPTPTPVASPSPSPTASPSPSQPATVQFRDALYRVTEGVVSVDIAVTRTGTTSGTATVNYFVNEGSANQKRNFDFAAGRVTFADGEAVKTFSVLITENAYQEGTTSATITLSNPTNAVLGGQSNTTLQMDDNDTTSDKPNAIDDTDVFVGMQYHDFLARQADDGGQAYWRGLIAECGNDSKCVGDRRVSVAAAFFIESEFQDTGSFIYRLSKASFGTRPAYVDFMTDRTRVPPGTDAERQASKVAYANEFVTRTGFRNTYPDSLTPDQYVSKLYKTAGLESRTTEQQQAADDLRNNRKSRADVLRDVAEIKEFRDREYNNAFVLMEYFGYLRRDPEEAGYQFWLDVVKNRDPSNYRGMVFAFITSREYRDRFGSR
ncbi:MAG: Calx-beta domain-containing protein [Pyrinomonadaceae bacterium]